MAYRFAKDCALCDEEHVLVVELLFELAGQAGLDSLELFVQVERDEDEKGASLILQLNLLNGADVQRLQLSAQVLTTQNHNH